MPQIEIQGVPMTAKQIEYKRETKIRYQVTIFLTNILSNA